MNSLLEGWRWVNNKFEFKEEWKQEDLNSSDSDQHRTMRELTKAMSSLVSFLQFEGEESGMYTDCKLPTLDTSIWFENNRFKYEFYEKPTCPNKVLQKDTALSEDSVRASLNQEVVRRLLLCSEDLPIERKQEILSKFAQKLLNSGFSLTSSQIILVHGVTRFLEIVENSKRPTDHPLFKPLHVDKNYRRLERKLDKYSANQDWYKGGKPLNVWRNKLPFEWRGSKPVQFKLPNMDFTSLLQVPSSKAVEKAVTSSKF